MSPGEPTARLKCHVDEPKGTSVQSFAGNSLCRQLKAGNILTPTVRGVCCHGSLNAHTRVPFRERTFLEKASPQLPPPGIPALPSNPSITLCLTVINYVAMLDNCTIRTKRSRRRQHGGHCLINLSQALNSDHLLMKESWPRASPHPLSVHRS